MDLQTLLLVWFGGVVAGAIIGYLAQLIKDDPEDAFDGESVNSSKTPPPPNYYF